MDPTPNHGVEAQLLAKFDAITRRLDELDAATGTQRAQAVKRLEETIAAMPVALSGSASNSQFAMTGGQWNTVAQAVIPAPAGKTIASVIAVASGQITAIMDGQSLATMDQRIVINGAASPAVYPMYRQGQSVLYHPIVVGFGATVAGGVTASLQVLPGSTAAFPPRSDSSVSLAVIAIYNS